MKLLPRKKSGKIHRAIMAALEVSAVPATCSLGSATGTGFTETLRIADQAMYRAKQAGKSSWRFDSANGVKSNDNS